MSKLAGKVAVVTGGSTGMGFATAKLFVEEGAYVYIFGRRQNELDAAAAEIGHNITAVQGDISNAADLDRLYAVIQQRHGHINVIFANAGASGPEPLGAITDAKLDEVINTNIKGTVFTIQKALPLLQDNSSIIINASISSSKAWPGLSIYSASKAAVRSLARTWSAELLDRKIRVNALSAGVIDTPMLKLGATDVENEQIKQGFAANVPMKRVGTPDEIAKPALFLASDDSSFITGIELFVDGGATQL